MIFSYNKNFCDKKHILYQKEFLDYLFSAKDTQSYQAYRKTCLYSSHLCKLWLFESENNSKESFVIVPSFFNSPEILFFNQNQSYVSCLQLLGRVYLIEWLETTKQTNLADYTAEITKILHSPPFADCNNHLIGHCIGGNIALFAALRSSNINSLTLLTTPWDYSHFMPSVSLSKHLQINKSVDNLTLIPPIYTQMLFFILFSERYTAQLNKYFISKPSAKEKYLRIEKWLQSGISIPNSLYKEITETLITDNALLNESFRIEGKSVLPAKLDIPVCLVAARDDQIAPISSITCLQKELKKATLITVCGGHIAYLVNDDQDFKTQYTNWFSNLKL